MQENVLKHCQYTVLEGNVRSYFFKTFQMCSDCKLKTKQSLDVVSALSADQVSTVFPRGVFVFFRGKFDRTGSTYRPPHHRSASQEERFSGFSFPSLLSKFSLQKSDKPYYESKKLDLLK